MRSKPIDSLYFYLFLCLLCGNHALANDSPVGNGGVAYPANGSASDRGASFVTRPGRANAFFPFQIFSISGRVPKTELNKAVLEILKKIPNPNRYVRHLIAMEEGDAVKSLFLNPYPKRRANFYGYANPLDFQLQQTNNHSNSFKLPIPRREPVSNPFLFGFQKRRNRHFRMESVYSRTDFNSPTYRLPLKLENPAQSNTRNYNADKSAYHFRDESELSRSFEPWLIKNGKIARTNKGIVFFPPTLYVYYDAALNQLPHNWSSQARKICEDYTGPCFFEGFYSIFRLPREIANNNRVDPQKKIYIILSHAEAGSIHFNDGALIPEDNEGASELNRAEVSKRSLFWKNLPMDSICGLGIFGCSAFKGLHMNRAFKGMLKEIQESLNPGQNVRLVAHLRPSTSYDDYCGGTNPLLMLDLSYGSYLSQIPRLKENPLGFPLRKYTSDEIAKMSGQGKSFTREINNLRMKIYRKIVKSGRFSSEVVKMAQFQINKRYWMTNLLIQARYGRPGILLPITMDPFLGLPGSDPTNMLFFDSESPIPPEDD